MKYKTNSNWSIDSTNDDKSPLFHSTRTRSDRIDRSTTMETRFEKLPNELILNTFEYLSIIELFRTFFNLNQRFNELLQTNRYRLNFSYSNQNEIDYFRNEIFPNVDRFQIESIFIDDIADRLTLIRHFDQLRSLKIEYLRSTSIDPLVDEILPSLKHLTRLSIHSDLKIPSEKINRLTQILLGSEIVSLNYCHLALETFHHIRFNHLTSTCRNFVLKTLIIDQWCLFKDLIELFRHIPMIERLTVRLFDSEFHQSKTFSFDENLSNESFVPNLIYFRTKLSHISFRTALNFFSTYLPSTLRELSLSTWSIDYSNGVQWQNFLEEKFPEFQRFRLIISLDRIPLDFNNDLNEFVQQFNRSNYFLTRHSTVALNVNERDSLKFVLHTLPYPIENFQTSLFNNRRSILNEQTMYNTYRHVQRLTLTLEDQFDFKSNSNDSRRFSHVDELIFQSNFQNDYSRFQSDEYFQQLKRIVDFSFITKLKLVEEIHQYPLEFIRNLIENLPRLTSLTLPNRLFACLHLPTILTVRHLTIIFTLYASFSSILTRLHYLLPFHQILTNEILIELIENSRKNFPFLQTLSIVVRNLDESDEQMIHWFQQTFSSRNDFSFDLLINDRTFRFSF